MKATVREMLTGVQVAALRASITSAFGTICGSPPEYLGEAAGRATGAEVVGISALVGDLSWSLAIGLPRETSVGLARKFSGFEIPFDSPDMFDVVGEFSNILGGDLVTRLRALGIDVRTAPATVARGDVLEILLPGGPPAIRMRYRVPQGELWIGLAAANHR